MVAITQKLGRGMYTASEASLYARVQTRLLNRWLFDADRSVIRPEFGRQERADKQERTVSFLDFVEALAIRDITQNHGVPLQEVRRAYDLARNEYKVEHPFARKHCTYLFGEHEEGSGNKRRRRSERRELVIKLGEGRLVQVTGKERGNYMIAQLSELFMRDLTFDAATQTANAYRPLTMHDRSVLMDPDRRFGEPIIESCGYSALTLYDAYHSEGGIENAAKAYGVEEDDVALAIRYFDYLRPPAK